MLFGIKQMDLLHRSEISYETQMGLYELSSIKGDHNGPFVVRKDDMIKYLESVKPPQEEKNPEDSPMSFLDHLSSFVAMMKTNNLYIQ